jgi:hypothetical protein
MIYTVTILGSVLIMGLAVSEQFTIADRQRCLARLGFDVGRIDGQWGARSQEALRTWTKQEFQYSWKVVDQKTIELRLQCVCADPPSTAPLTPVSRQALPSPAAPTKASSSASTQDSSSVWGLFGFLLLIGIVALFFVPTIIASSKGRSGFGFFVYSVFLWPIALIHALIMEPSQKNAEEHGIASGELRRCPFCAEPIQVRAVRCRYCGADLKGDTHTNPTIGDSA